ncbi:MAG: LCP family protein [Candidatus Paceibacteria bacterium]
MKNNKPVDFLQKEKKIQQQESRWKKYLFWALISVSLVAIITGASFAAMPSSASDSPEGFEDQSLQPKEPNDFLHQIGSVINKAEQDKLKNRDRINVLLLGMGGPGHDGPYLTDTIIIASIKPDTGEVAMVSIPRDLRVKIPEVGYRKINYVNAYGESKKENWGAAYTTKLIEKKFELDIQYYVRVDFEAFTSIVDKMGGLKINVTRGFVDDSYPAENNKYQTIEFEQGVQQMDGKRALKFARSRHGTNNQNSDFSRARRQQKVLLAAKRKALSYDTLTDPDKIYGIYKSMNEHITTNMNLSDIMSMADLAEKIDIQKIKTLVLNNEKDGLLTAKTIDGVFYLVPKNGNFDNINQKIKNVFDLKEDQQVVTATTSSTLSPEQISRSETNIEIQNGTWQPGLAAQTKEELTEASLSVSTIGNTNEKPIKNSGIYKINDNVSKETLSRIKNKIDIPVQKQLRPGIKISTSTEVLVILGQDFQK